MKMCFYLTGGLFFERETNGEEVQKIMSAYDSRDCSRIQIKEGSESFHIAKSHIIAIRIIRTIKTKQKLN